MAVVGPVRAGSGTPPFLVLTTKPAESMRLNSPLARLSSSVPLVSGTTSRSVVCLALTWVLASTSRTVGLPLARSTATGARSSFRNTEP